MATRTNEAVWIESRKRWQINVQKDGERRTFTSSIVGKKGKIAAEKKSDKWIESNTSQENIRFNKLWEMFLAEIKLTTSTANHLKHKQIGKNWLMPKLKTKRVCSITAQNWQDCINAAHKKGLSKKTCENIRGSITRLYSYAKKNRIPMENPDTLTIPRNAVTKTKNILQPSDLKKLFQKDTTLLYGKEIQAFFINAWRFIVLTGLRRGELCGLKHEDIKDGIIHINRSISAELEVTTCKTANSRRYFVISKHAQEVLDSQAKLLKDSGIISPWVFPDECGECLSPHHLYKKWATYRKQHDIKCTLHEMRHTFISVAKADVPEQLLKRAVGHTKNMDTFGVYGHDVEGEMTRVANIMDGVFDTLLK